jgi:hypothetical protein
VRCSTERTEPKMDIMDYYRHSELAERTESAKYHLFINYTNMSFPSINPAQRGWQLVQPPLPTHSLGRWVPKRETFTLVSLVSTRNEPIYPYFGPTDIACLPGPKIDRNFRNFVINKKNKYLFYFL